MWDVVASILWFGVALTCVIVLTRYVRRARSLLRHRDHGLDVIKDPQDVT